MTLQHTVRGSLWALPIFRKGTFNNPAASFQDCLFVIDANSMAANVPSTSYWADEPRVGVSENSLFITADMRASDSNSTFQYSKLWMIPKTNVYNSPTGSCPRENVGYYFWNGLQNGDGTFAYQVIPVKTYDYNDPTGYLVSAHWNGGSELSLWTINDAKPSISPGLKGMAVATSPGYDPLDENRIWFIGAYPGGKFLTCPDGSANYDRATWAGILSFTGPLSPLPPSSEAAAMITEPRHLGP
jgi:hypothetical protein